jgi:hypothetical protein
MSKKNADYSIGYERLLVHFSDVQKQAPKGVSLKRTGQTIAFQFDLTGSRRNKASGCSFTYDGIAKALEKAKKVAEALKTISSETKFWEWYDDIILEKNTIKADRLTFEQAIKKVETDFWKRLSKEKRKRDRNDKNDLASWLDTYGDFYKPLPKDKPVNLEDIITVISLYEEGTKTYIGCVSAMKKLARLAKNQKILEALGDFNLQQTKFRIRQRVSLESFLEWRDKTLGITQSLHPNADLDTRKQWLWVFSMQIVYGFRVHEVFAIENLEKPFKTKDGVLIPALNDSHNNTNIIVVGEFTKLGTTTKTGYRLTRPLIPPSCPNLIEKLDIKNPMLPDVQCASNNPKAVKGFYANAGRRQLVRWHSPFTQTHALRRLANLNGMGAGVSQEIRSQSLGHTPEQNDSAYKDDQHTTETLNLLLNSNKQAIDLLSAINEARTLLLAFPGCSTALSKLLAKIYSKDEKEIIKLLGEDVD